MNVVQPFIRVCASCKRINETNGQWITPHPLAIPLPDTQVTHGICPSCTKTLYPDLYVRLARRYPELFRKRA